VALARAGHILALYTGDSRPVAEKMLEASGMEHYFRLRFFGTEVALRTDMVKLAIEAAGKLAGRSFGSHEVVIIGDSVRDIEAGQAFGVRTILVATGAYTMDELRSRGADYVFPDVSDYHRVITAVES
jgi:phosphoglycolate phosphatase-like HAD superfamily hydrolase